MSPLYVGQISYVELTRVSAFLDVINDKVGISVMVDKGFTIRDMVKKINVELNIPAFLNEKQFTVQDISRGRKIASIRINHW